MLCKVYIAKNSGQVADEYEDDRSGSSLVLKKEGVHNPALEVQVANDMGQMVWQPRYFRTFPQAKEHLTPTMFDGSGKLRELRDGNTLTPYEGEIAEVVVEVLEEEAALRNFSKADSKKPGTNWTKKFTGVSQQNTDLSVEFVPIRMSLKEIVEEEVETPKA